MTPWNRLPREVVDVPPLEVQDQVGWGPMQPDHVGTIPSCVITAHNRVLDDIYGSFTPSLSHVKDLSSLATSLWATKILKDVGDKCQITPVSSMVLYTHGPWSIEILRTNNFK